MFAKSGKGGFLQEILLIFHKHEAVDNSESSHEETHVDEALVLE